MRCKVASLARRGGQGFTLVEILVVVAIIGLLAGLIIPSLMTAPDKANRAETFFLIEKIVAALQMYEHDWGDYPPTSLKEYDALTNGINDGIESLVAHMADKSKGVPYFEPEEKHLANIDRDSIPASFNPNWYFGDRQAREIVDSWGNPLVYFHHRDYSSPKSHMRTYKLAGGRSMRGFKPGKSKKTATFHSWSSYQLWSVGPNGKNENGEGDDIVSWGKK